MSRFPRTVHDIIRGLRGREFSAVEIVRHYLDRIAAHDGAIGAFLHIDEEGALRGADASARGSALGGVPIGLKDLLATKDMPTTSASKILAGYRPPYDATVVRKLKAAGAVFPGKLNMDEFAMGSSNENSAVKPVRNPWDAGRVPGGSSGGSAAAVAAGLVPAALGSDTGGSIRQPGAFCGVTALKPTYGRVSRYGLFAFASSLDQIGPLTIDARDAAILMEAIAGHDPLDSTSANLPVGEYTRELTGKIGGLRVGIPKEYFAEGIDPGVESKVRAAIDQLRSLGAEIVDVTLPHTRHAVAVYYLVATAEASSNLARYDGVRFGLRVEAENLADMYRATRGAGFGSEVKRRIMLGTYCLSSGYYDAYYMKALKVRTLIQRDFLEAFEKVDLIAAPTSPTVAFRFGEKTSDPLKMYLSDVFTISANHAGLPAISIPCGFAQPESGTTPSPDGLPVGLQLIGRPFEEATVLRAADAYQRSTDWHTRRPKEFDS